MWLLRCSGLFLGHYYAVARVFWLVQGVLSSVPLLSFHLFDYSK